MQTNGRLMDRTGVSGWHRTALDGRMSTIQPGDHEEMQCAAGVTGWSNLLQKDGLQPLCRKLSSDNPQISGWKCTRVESTTKEPLNKEYKRKVTIPQKCKVLTYSHFNTPNQQLHKSSLSPPAPSISFWARFKARQSFSVFGSRPNGKALCRVEPVKPWRALGHLYPRMRSQRFFAVKSISSPNVQWNKAIVYINYSKEPIVGWETHCIHIALTWVHRLCSIHLFDGWIYTHHWDMFGCWNHFLESPKGVGPDPLDGHAVIFIWS